MTVDSIGEILDLMQAENSVVLTSTNDLSKVSQAPAKIHLCHSQDKLKLSARTFGLFWGLAIASVFIPVFHFVLVPLFFIIGIIAGLKALKITTCIDEAEIKCPACGGLLKYNKRYLTPPTHERCSFCATQLSMDVNLRT